MSSAAPRKKMKIPSFDIFFKKLNLLLICSGVIKILLSHYFLEKAPFWNVESDLNFLSHGVGFFPLVKGPCPHFMLPKNLPKSSHLGSWVVGILWQPTGRSPWATLPQVFLLSPRVK